MGEVSLFMDAVSLRPKKKKLRFAAVGNRDGLVDRVVHAIEAQILDGRLAVGTRLPSEREFSEVLGVSRPVVREAVRILTARGQLATQHGVGTTVRSIGCTEIAKPVTLFLRSRGETIDIKHLHQVRSILEVEGAGLAAEHRTEADVQRLTAICACMEEESGDPAKFALRDHEFHQILSESAHNPLLSVLLDTVHEMMAEVRRLVSNAPGLFEQVMPTHRLLVQAIAGRDALGAQQAMCDHLAIAIRIQTELLANRKGGITP